MRNCKFIYLIVLTIIFFSCNSSEKSSDEQAVQKNMGVQGNNSQKFIIDDKTPYREDTEEIKTYSRSIGKSSKIKPSKAALKLFKFKEWADIADNDRIDQTVTFKNVNYGYMFSFNQLRDYINEIDRYNQSQPDSLLRIINLRVYHGAVSGTGNKYIPDVFLYPATVKGNAVDIDADYPTVLKELAEKGTLDEFFEKLDKSAMNTYGEGFNSSVPCPTACP